MSYTMPNWQDSPSTATPLSSANLLEYNTAINDIDLRIVGRAVALTDATTIAVDASKGNFFRVTLGGNRTMGAPTNATDGQRILFEITQDATGSRTLTWTSGAGGYEFDVATPTLTTTANAHDYLAFVYNSAANRWIFDPNAGSVRSVTAGDTTITIGGTAYAPTVAVNAIAESKVTNLTTDLAAKAPTASPTFTGTATFAKVVETPVALTDAVTIAVDASLGNYFRVTLGGNRTMGAPTNPTDGQKILFEIIQDATGSRTITWTSSAGGYEFGTTVATPTLTTTASKRDFVGFVYNSTANLWYGIAFAAGY